MKNINEDGAAMVGGVPTNSTGPEIAGIGVGPQGEPGVKKGKKNKVMSFKSFLTRRLPT
ncbi:hypothetical protein M0R04_05105 [Candidatus Dojkabacteria bacterium]|jgi:hypothetical protein|nr:hypothetical protein [Candidatus Dojkabacteria bacterium]